MFTLKVLTVFFFSLQPPDLVSALLAPVPLLLLHPTQPASLLPRPQRLPEAWAFLAVKGLPMLPRQQRRRQPPSLGLIAQPLALLWPTPLPPPEPAAPWALVQTITYLTKTQRLVTTVLIGRQTIAASCLRTSGKVSYTYIFSLLFLAASSTVC